MKDGQWVGPYVGMKLPTECSRCKDSFFAEDVSTEEWFWIDVERDGIYVSESVCSHCLDPNERNEIYEASQLDPLLYTVTIRENDPEDYRE